MKKKPSISSINRYLKSRNKQKQYRIVEDLPGNSAYPSAFPYDVVQLDGEGNKVIENIGAVTVINLKDVYSKTYVLSYPLRLKSKFSHAKTADYQNCLRLAFMDFGLFKRLQVDHESVFYDNTSKSPFPTTFHLWLVGIGIELCFTPKGIPQKQGCVERSHQTMHKQIFEGRIYEEWEEVLEESWKRRNRLNYHIPSRVLNKQAPLVACPGAKHSGKKYKPEREDRLFKQERIHDYLASCKGWYRRITKNRIRIGKKSYGLRNTNNEQETKLIFNGSTGEFDLYNINDEFMESIKPKGISFENLKGDLEQFITWEKEHRLFMPKK